MTGEIVLALAILAGVVGLFAWGRLRPDMVALLTLAAVSLTGILSPSQALSGFSNNAVVAVAGMFVISAGLARTGVAGVLGRKVMEVAGRGEARLVVALMLVSGVLSGFMNNVGVAAMMLPVVVEIARKTGLPPSKLLIPMALGAQLGGFTTLIGTPGNLLASEVLTDVGLEGFGLLEFTPMGLILLLIGTVFVAMAAPRLLPTRDPRGEGTGARPELREDLTLEERIFGLRVPEGSLLEGKTLAESLIGSALGLQVLAVERGRERTLSPRPGTVLRGGDRLVVQGQPNLLRELQKRRHLVAEAEHDVGDWLASEEVGLARLSVEPDARFVGSTLNDIDFRKETGAVVLAIRRGDGVRRTHLQDTPLVQGDVLLVQAPRERLTELGEREGIEDLQAMDPAEAMRDFSLRDRLTALRIADSSLLDGRTLAETHLGDAMGLTVLAVVRGTETHTLPDPDLPLRIGDILLVKADPEDLASLRGLQRLEVEEEVEVEGEELESERTGFVEVVLAPRSGLVGKTLRQLNFRGRFGVSVLAIWREDQTLKSDLRDEVLQFGDALLLYGPRERLRDLLSEPNFIVITEAVPEAPRTQLAPLSLVIVAAALVPVMVGWIPISIAVVAASILLVLTRCLTTEEAYRAVDLPTVVLVAGMLSLGIALDETGAAAYLGEKAVGNVAGLGPRGVLLVLCLVTAVGAQVIPGAALVVLLAPVAISAGVDLGISPRALVMGIALTGTTLASPVAHPAHALVMAPAGYRMGDFLRLGLPLTLMVVVAVVVFVPFFFPL